MLNASVYLNFLNEEDWIIYTKYRFQNISDTEKN